MIDHVSSPLQRDHHLGHVGRIWQLRSSFSAAAATYVTLAESLGATFVTVDQRLAAATRAYTSAPLIP
jgi:predicted nucleic acid-binding protein